MRPALITLITASLLVPVGCEPESKSEKGFRLPDGDAEKGKETFVAFKCHQCHKVEGVVLPAPTGDVGPVTLGGEVARVKTYGQLVTAIINPSHSLAEGYPPEKVAPGGKSKMPVFNDTLTVTQLSNLVAFLQAQYKIKRYDDQYYSYGP